MNAGARGSPKTDRSRRVDVGVEQRRDELALWRLREGEEGTEPQDGQDRTSEGGVGLVTRCAEVGEHKAERTRQRSTQK